MVLYSRLNKSGDEKKEVSVEEAQNMAAKDLKAGDIVGKKDEGKEDYSIIRKPEEITEKTKKVMTSKPVQGGI